MVDRRLRSSGPDFDGWPRQPLQEPHQGPASCRRHVKLTLWRHVGSRANWRAVLRNQRLPKPSGRSFSADPQPTFDLSSYPSCVASHSLPRTRNVPKTRLWPAYRAHTQACMERQGRRAVITTCLNCGHHRDAHEHYRRSPSDTECALCNCSKFMQRRRSFFGWLAWLAGRKRWRQSSHDDLRRVGDLPWHGGVLRVT